VVCQTGIKQYRCDHRVFGCVGNNIPRAGYFGALAAADVLPDIYWGASGRSS
jgi:hypothetical protein